MHDDYIAHYGVKRRSGRYPWGSGERPYQSDPQKAKLMKKYERTESDSWKKVARMVEKGKSQEKIGDYSWQQSNKLGDIKRKLIRLETGEAARAAGIYDKKLINAAADYEWGKKMAKQYAEAGRGETKINTDAITRDVTFWTVLGGPITGVVAAAVSPGKYTLKGSDYYEKIAQKAEAIWEKKMPSKTEMLKMLED